MEILTEANEHFLNDVMKMVAFAECFRKKKIRLSNEIDRHART